MAINKNLIVAAAALGAVLLAMKGRGNNASNKRAALINLAKSDKDKAAFEKLSNTEIDIAYEKLIKNNPSVNAQWQQILNKFN